MPIHLCAKPQTHTNSQQICTGKDFYFQSPCHSRSEGTVCHGISANLAAKKKISRTHKMHEVVILVVVIVLVAD
jgi:hypothetical protein